MLPVEGHTMSGHLTVKLYANYTKLYREIIDPSTDTYVMSCYVVVFMTGKNGKRLE